MWRVLISWRASSRRAIRVSSAAISGTARRVSIARRVTSPRFPIGVATTYSVPRASGTRSGAAGARAPPRVQVVDAGGPRSELGDRRHLALELRGCDEPLDALDERAVEAHLRQLVGAPAAVDPPVQDAVEQRVAEGAVVLVGLVGPQVGARRLGDDLPGHTDRRRELPNLALVQVADRVEGARVVPEQRRVADQRLGLVAGAHDQPAERRRAVVEDRHAHPGHEVAAAERRRLADAFTARATAGLAVRAEIAVDHRRDVDQRARTVEVSDDRLGVRAG